MAEINKSNKNIVITGFMGTGKTAVGLVVAELLNRDFIDTDQIIQKRARKSIAQIFAQPGEAYFRRMENELVAELSSKSSTVISTGGGTLLNNGNHQLLRESSLIFCLTARPDIVQEWLAEVKDRPLLGTSPSVECIRELMKERKVNYAKLPNHIDTSDIGIQNVASKIIELFRRMTD